MTSTRTPPQAESRRELRKRERRQRLYDTAIRLFRRRGYEAVTVTEIAQAAGLSRATFFNHYEGKGEILAQCSREVLTGLVTYGEALRADSARALFGRFFGRMADVYRDQGRLLDALVRNVKDEPGQREMHRQAVADVIGLYHGFVRKGIDAGELPPDTDVELVAELLRDLWLSSLRSWVESDRRASLKTRVRKKLDLVFRGIGA